MQGIVRAKTDIFNCRQVGRPRNAVNAICGKFWKERIVEIRLNQICRRVEFCFKFCCRQPADIVRLIIKSRYNVEVVGQ